MKLTIQSPSASVSSTSVSAFRFTVYLPHGGPDPIETRTDRFAYEAVTLSGTAPDSSIDIDDLAAMLTQADPSFADALTEGRKAADEILYGDAPLSLKRLRLQAGLSQDDLAAKTGIKQANLSLMERGKRTPALQNLRKLSNALGVDLETVAQAALNAKGA